jgi:hypothetical protein
MVVLQPAMDPFRRAAFAVTNVFRDAVSDPALPLRLLLQFLLQPGDRTRMMSIVAARFSGQRDKLRADRSKEA